MKYTKKEFEKKFVKINLWENEKGVVDGIVMHDALASDVWDWIEEAIKEARFEACNKCYKTGLKEGREEATGISFRKSVALDDDIADIEHG